MNQIEARCQLMILIVSSFWIRVLKNKYQTISLINQTNSKYKCKCKEKTYNSKSISQEKFIARHKTMNKMMTTIMERNNCNWMKKI